MFAVYIKSVHVSTIEDFLAEEYQVYSLADFIEEVYLRQREKDFDIKDVLQKVMHSPKVAEIFVNGIKNICYTVGIDYNEKNIFTTSFRKQIAELCVEKLTILQSLNDTDKFEICMCEGSVYYHGEEIFHVLNRGICSDNMDIDVDISERDFWVLCEVPPKSDGK